MKLISIRTVQGPNVYHHHPVMIMKVDLGSWKDKASNEIPGFIDKLVTLLPGISEHFCSLGHAGGFVERLARGTYMAHIMEHVALELSKLAGIGVRFGKSRNAGAPTVYHVITSFRHEDGMRECLFTAFDLIDALLNDQNFDLEERLEDIRQISRYSPLGPSGQALLQAARARGIPCQHIGPDSLLQLGYGKNQRRLLNALTDRTSLLGVELVQDKNRTKAVLAAAHVPVPQGHVITLSEDMIKIMQRLRGPYAVKPLDSHHGQGVTLNLHSLEEMQSAFQIAKKFSSSVLVEEMCEGKDYRVLVVDRKVVAVAERTAPSIKGDGKSSILQLIEKLNQDPLRGDGHCSVLSRIVIEDALLETLQRQGLDLNSVPASDQWVLLRSNANLSSGGTAKDVTAEIHPQVREICEPNCLISL